MIYFIRASHCNCSVWCMLRNILHFICALLLRFCSRTDDADCYAVAVHTSTTTPPTATCKRAIRIIPRDAPRS